MNNFVTRTLSSIVFAAILIFCIIWDDVTFVVLFSFVIYKGLQEFYKISFGTQYKQQQILCIGVGVTAFLISSSHLFWGLSLSYLFIPLVLLFLVPIYNLFALRIEDFTKLTLLYYGLIYIALPISLFSLLIIRNDGEYSYNGYLLLSLFIILWLSDIGAYCLGTLFGQKPSSAKLAPHISPKKSWWGFWSGIAFAIGTAVALHYLTWLPFTLWQCVALGAIVSVGGVCGDLIESMWKRSYGVKDSGKLIPGHGGILDRFDSSLIALPLALAFISLI